MRVLGIDPGTGITGFGIVDVQANGNYDLIDAGVIRTKANTPLPERLLIIHSSLQELMTEHKPHVVSVEKLFFAQNVTTAISVSHARGVVLLAAEAAEAEIAEYTPLQIKQALTGYGRAEKSQIQEMVRVLLRLKSPPKPDDCADALAAAICHAMSATGLQPV